MRKKMMLALVMAVLVLGALGVIQVLNSNYDFYPGGGSFGGSGSVGDF